MFMSKALRRSYVNSRNSVRENAFSSNPPNEASNHPAPEGRTNVAQRFTACGKKPALLLLLGGAAVYRCGNYLVLNSALAAEGTALEQELLFPQVC
jgi:hypothetical protein